MDTFVSRIAYAWCVGSVVVAFLQYLSSPIDFCMECAQECTLCCNQYNSTKWNCRYSQF